MKGGLRIYKEKREGGTRGDIIRSIRAQTGLEIRPRNPADPRDVSTSRFIKKKEMGGEFEVSSLSLNGPKWALKLSQMSSEPSRRTLPATRRPKEEIKASTARFRENNAVRLIDQLFQPSDRPSIPSNLQTLESITSWKALRSLMD